MAGRTTRRAGTGSARQTPRTGQKPRRAAAPKAAGSSRRYVTSLDGLRAVCALGVVFYHMGLAWCTGGLLGVTVLFVSHNIQQVKAICDTAILLEKGHIIASGDVDTVAAVYEEKSGKKK